MPSEFALRAIALIRRIPEGKVASYGQIARLAGRPRAARRVAWLLHGASDGLPWHRVVNAAGAISPRAGDGPARQREKLLAEGVAVDAAGAVDLAVYLWRPEEATASLDELSPEERCELERFL